MFGIDTQLSCLTRQDNEVGLSGEDLFFCGDDINVNGVCHRKPFFGKSNRVLQQALP
jgi:hypothetical protein